MTQKESAEQTALKIFKDKFSSADTFLLAGSVMRGEGTASSDLDIVALYSHIDAAFRESFFFDGWPVEVFVHDLQTLNYFFEKMEKPGGVPSLPNMVLEGKEIPGVTELSRQAKELAKKTLRAGPSPWTKTEIDRARYVITDLCDDMKNPRSSAELNATASRLYELLTEFHFRSQNKWSARGKSIPRKWKQESPDLADQFIDSFDRLFRQGEVSALFTFVDKVLAPNGGNLFEGYKILAPDSWKLPL